MLYLVFLIVIVAIVLLGLLYCMPWDAHRQPPPSPEPLPETPPPERNPAMNILLWAALATAARRDAFLDILRTRRGAAVRSSEVLAVMDMEAALPVAQVASAA